MLICLTILAILADNENRQNKYFYTFKQTPLQMPCSDGKTTLRNLLK